MIYIDVVGCCFGCVSVKLERKSDGKCGSFVLDATTLTRCMVHGDIVCVRTGIAWYYVYQ